MTARIEKSKRLSISYHSPRIAAKTKCYHLEVIISLVQAKFRFRFWIAVFSALSLAVFSGCPGGGGEGDGGAQTQRQTPFSAALILPELPELPRGASSLESFVAGELQSEFDTIFPDGTANGHSITAESLDAIALEALPADIGAVVVSEGFPDGDVLEFADRLNGRAHVYVFSDSEFPAGSGVTAISFDYTALGFLGGAFAGLMTKAGKLGAFFDVSTYRGRALLEGVTQGAKWTRGGASIDSAAPKDLEPDKVISSVKALYIAGREYLLYDSTYFGDYPIIAIAGTQRRLFAFGRGVNSVAPGSVVTSYVCDYRGALSAILKDAAAGKKHDDGIKIFGLESELLGNTGYAEYRRYSTVDETYVSTVETCKKEIVSGEIVLKRPDRTVVKISDAEAAAEN